ncbi:MAG: enoyl-CoA hydratase/isomerase family protein [Rhodoplanes sp.]|uniref:enoyl-CoA hydratase/isomerase family protein n=1 Tax=Rhodoplanes sp. TaxID=1968906 RepID=UPI001813F1A2|nr:enoyl-CoA hydratase/isomerase family protein [Rhodoplanes sp.]NVO15512.1 enoyl-CoA hydratase/isomerase family protein [Rhodoplanes sp.]
MISVMRDGAVLRLMLDRPQRRNALGTAGIQALDHALAAADQDDGVRAIVLTGAPPAFCAGSDLKELGGLSIADMCAHEEITAAVARKIALMTKPVVCAVEGYALGGGFILAVSCDVVVTATDAKWRLPEVANGWLPPWGLQALLARVGPVRARMLVWGVEAIDGAEAHRLGVADLVTPAGGALDRAMAYAIALAALPAEAVTSTKRFFELFAGRDAERLDAVASRAFAHDCLGPAAAATLARFTVTS